MSPEELRDVLADVASVLATRRVTARVYIVGGAAMALAYRSDRHTADIDGLILEGHGDLTAAVREVAERRGLPSSWLNEQASSYMPRGHDPSGRVVFDHPSLRVIAASPERLLAMKVRAARRTDIEDIERLIEIVGCRSAEDVLDLTLRLYPDEPIPKRGIAVVESLFPDADLSRGLSLD